MAYDGKLLRLAQLEYERDKDRRELEFQQRRERIYQRQPRLREIESRLSSTTSRIIAGALRQGTDPGAAIAALRAENLELQEEKRALLMQMGLPMDCLDEVPACGRCGDSGFVGGQVCRCLRAYYTREQQKELSRMLDLGSQSFDTFKSGWYPDQCMPGRAKTYRQHMEDTVYETCVAFAHQFGRRPSNLLLFGPPGLGKTHLSAAIAREVSAKGFSVVYDTAGQVFQRFEQQKFGREDEEIAADVERILACDLLILDDLGTEMTTAFVQSALYQIINTRLMERKSTIISTNLRVNELAQRYSAQIASRIEGEYQLLPFVGDDIRRLKRQRSNDR